MDTTKVLEGIDLVDRELDSLTAQKSAVEAEIAGLATREESLRAQLAETEAALEVVSARPTVSARALAVIAAMESVGCDENTCRAAIVAQFGKLPPHAPAKALKPPSAKGTAEKKISSGLPSADIQAAILADIKNAGLVGIRMEELNDKYGKNVEHSAVFATVKNARIDGLVRREGTTRGMRYFFENKPVVVAAPAEENAPAEATTAPAEESAAVEVPATE